MANDNRFYLEPGQKATYPQLHILNDLITQASSQSDFDIESLHCAFKKLLKSDELPQLVIEVMARLSEGDAEAPNWLSVTSEEWYILETPHVSMRSFVARPAKGKTISSLKYDSIVGVLSEPSQIVNLHRFPKALDLDVFERDIELDRGDGHELTKGNALLLRADRDVPEYRVSEPSIVIILYKKMFKRLAWIFDSETMKSLMATSTHDRPIRLQAGAELIKQLHRTEILPIEKSVEYLITILKDRHHYVRWTALQALCEIDFDVGKEYLVLAADDPHPTVSEAAKKAIQQLLN